MLLIAAIGGIFNYSYSQAVDFGHELPYYASKVGAEVTRFRKEAESFEVLPSEHEKEALNVHPTPDWAAILRRGFGSLGTAILAGSFVPFLTSSGTY